MRYRLLLRDPAGRPLTLHGFKLLEDDPNFDSWRDVTTLFVRLHRGHLAERDERAGELVATGVLRLSAWGFLRELLTFRGTGGSLLRASAGRRSLPGLLPAQPRACLPRRARARRPAQLPPRPGRARLGSERLGERGRPSRPAQARRALRDRRRARAEPAQPRRHPRADARAGPALARRGPARRGLLRPAGGSHDRRRPARRGVRRLGAELARLHRPAAQPLHARPGRPLRPSRGGGGGARAGTVPDAEGDRPLPGIRELHDGGGGRAAARGHPRRVQRGIAPRARAGGDADRSSC